jgi:signal transduction histidine kinase
VHPRFSLSDWITFGSAARAGLFEYDPAAGEVRCTSEAARTLGIQTDLRAIVGDHFFDRIHPDDRDRVREALENSLKTQAPYSQQFRTIRGDRTLEWVSATGGVLDDAAGRRLAGAVARLAAEANPSEPAGSSARKETPDARQSEAFAYAVSHDLRAPLRALAGLSRILAEEHAHELSETARGHVELIIATADRMSTLTEDLLRLFRFGRAEMTRELTSPADLVRQAFADLRDETVRRDVRLLVGDLPPCHAAPNLLLQVYINLLSNALKFTRQSTPAIIEAGWRADAAGPVYFVRDKGVGFDERWCHKLFAPFQRLHSGHEFEGTGVGLAIVKEIVQRHGGRVWAESTLGRGATFSFTLG